MTYDTYRLQPPHASGQHCATTARRQSREGMFVCFVCLYVKCITIIDIIILYIHTNDAYIFDTDQVRVPPIQVQKSAPRDEEQRAHGCLQNVATRRARFSTPSGAGRCHVIELHKIRIFIYIPCLHIRHTLTGLFYGIWHLTTCFPFMPYGLSYIVYL
jgi:hypothetical protein